MSRKMKVMSKMNTLILIITIFTITQLSLEIPGFPSRPLKRSLIWSLSREVELIKPIMKSKK